MFNSCRKLAVSERQLKLVFLPGNIFLVGFKDLLFNAFIFVGSRVAFAVFGFKFSAEVTDFTLVGRLEFSEVITQLSSHHG